MTPDPAAQDGQTPVRLLLAEDQVMIREALAALLSFEGDMEIVAQVGRGDEVLKAAQDTHPDVAVLDIEMPGLDGLAAAAELKKILPGTKIVILTTFGRPGFLRRAMESGVSAFLVKDSPADKLSQTIRRVLAGERVIDPDLAAAALADGLNPLTPRERDVLEASTDGGTIAQIAGEVLPRGVSFDWTELAYQQILAGNTSMYVFPLCILLAFLVLAAQYESWSLPLAVVLIVPMTLLFALTGVLLTHGDSNIFTQVGFVVLIALACKNAILMVEFAHDQETQNGMAIVPAALEAARLRLRPILMTSFAFIMGVIPLVLATGAGAEMRHAMGVAVFSGMLGVSAFGIFLTPVFFVAIRTVAARRAERKAATVLLPAPAGDD